MAYENKPKIMRDKDKERSEEERFSLNRQRARRELNKRKKELQRQEDQQLSQSGSRKERNEIRARADAALEQAEANFNETYDPSQNKQDYESDVLQRGIDQFTAPESNNADDGSFSQSILICSNNSLKQADVFMRGEPTSV
tara:strand:- start:81 stop:503 length:423 start_codon:yes stop_codon:yes gene_type:complete